MRMCQVVISHDITQPSPTSEPEKAMIWSPLLDKEVPGTKRITTSTKHSHIFRLQEACCGPDELLKFCSKRTVPGKTSWYRTQMEHMTFASGDQELDMPSHYFKGAAKNTPLRLRPGQAIGLFTYFTARCSA